jgi:response regulator RpfG family c-di-GMP phosphodiesterase
MAMLRNRIIPGWGPAVTDKILFVDDDGNILSAYQRQLRKQFHIDTALGGEPGLEMLARNGPYAVIVSDMRMPGMDGVRFLSEVKERAQDSIRMMLTGNNDLLTAMQAVNEGSIFRFLTKPCSPETLAQSLEAGIRQYRLITAERELLEKTLGGALGVLTDILAIFDPESFGRAKMLSDLVQSVARQLKVENAWELKVAAMLSQLGLVAVPPGVAAKARSGSALNQIEADMLARVPEVGRQLLARIPRLESIAEIVLYQNKRFDGSGFPQNEVAGKNIPFGARILKVLGDLVQAESRSIGRTKALHHIRARKGWYDPEVLDAVISCLGGPGPDQPPAPRKSRPVSVRELLVGHLLMSDIRTSDGLLLLSAGHRISEAILPRIKNIAQISAIQEPILVESA